MLSNLIVTEQRFVVIIDNLGEESISQKFLTQLLKEQGESDDIKVLPIGIQLDNQLSLQTFLNECSCEPEERKYWNIILPTLSDFLAYQKPSKILHFLNNLKRHERVKRTFVWISPQHIMHDHSEFLIAACEYMADLILNLHTSNELAVLIRKPGGGVINRHYTYTRSKTEFNVQMKTIEDRGLKTSKKDGKQKVKEQLSTFKIELDEEEMMARKALKMPYEKAEEAVESNIIYTPDAADDFDDEDPDEDLII